MKQEMTEFHCEETGQIIDLFVSISKDGFK